MSAVRPLALILVALVLASFACSSGAGGPPQGFTIVYTAPGSAASDAGAEASADAPGESAADAPPADGGADAVTDLSAEVGTDAGVEAPSDVSAGADGSAEAGADAPAEAGADAPVEAGADAPTVVSPGPVFRSIRGSGPGSAWALGDDGMAVHLNGSTWTPVSTRTTATLGGLSMFTISNAYAVELGGARVLGWSGGSWSPIGADRADRAAAATFGVASNDVWVAGNGVEHWDGKTWTQEVPSGALYTSLFASFETDLWAVGPGGIQHYDGKTWTAMTPPSGAGTLRAVWVSQLWDTWIVGDGGTVLHWDGSSISQLASGTMKNLTCISGSSAIDVWVGGQDGTLQNWNGTQWVSYTPPGAHTINDVWRAQDAYVYLVDDAGAIMQLVP